MSRVRSLLLACFTPSGGPQPPRALCEPERAEADIDTSQRKSSKAPTTFSSDAATSAQSEEPLSQAMFLDGKAVIQLAANHEFSKRSLPSYPANACERASSTWHPSTKSLPRSSTGTASVRLLGAGISAEVHFLDGDDKSGGSCLLSGTSPFQTSAAVPFTIKNPATVGAGATSSTLTPGRITSLNLADSPSNPFDTPASANAGPYTLSLGNLPPAGDDLLVTRPNPLSQGYSGSGRGRQAQHLFFVPHVRQCSAVAAPVAGPPPSLCMQSYAMRLSLPAISVAQTRQEAQQPCSCVGSSCAAPTAFPVAGGGCCPDTAGAAGPVEHRCVGLLSGAVVERPAFASTSTANAACGMPEQQRGSGQSGSSASASAAAVPITVDPLGLGVGDCAFGGGCAGFFPEPSLTLALPLSQAQQQQHQHQQQRPVYEHAATLCDLPSLTLTPNLPGLRSGGPSQEPPPSPPTPGAAVQSPPPPHPADNFLRFIDLDSCWAEMRDLSFVGSGAGGHVYSGSWCGMPVAVKFMLSGDVGQLQRQRREAALSRLASHPHLVQTYAVAAAQLTPAHFQLDPALRRLSGLSHSDLLGSCAPGGASIADLYGTASVSPAPSARIRRVSMSTLRHAGASGPGSASPGVAAAGSLPPPPIIGGAAARSVRSGARGSSEYERAGARGSIDYDRPSPFKAGPRASGEYDRAIGARKARLGASLSPLAGRSSHGGQAAPPSAPRPLQFRLSRPSQPLPQQQQSGGLRSGQGIGLLQRSGSRRGEFAAQVRPDSARDELRRRAAQVAVAEDASLERSTASTLISEVDMDAGDLQVNAKADSFTMSPEDHCGLMTFQPADVLAHIGARPGQWLTVVIMEEMDRGSLHRSIHNGLFQPTNAQLHKRHRVRAMARTLLEVAQGMARLHASGLVHGDLKPANVLLKSNSRDVRGFVAKVSDFGVTRAMAEGASQATVSTSEWGTVIYTAPEVFNGKAGPASDVFSFGVLTWQLATGQMPHEDINPFAVMLAVSRGELELEWPASVPRPLRKLGRLCTQYDPERRPTFPQIARALLKLEGKMRLCSLGAEPSACSGASSHVAVH